MLLIENEVSKQYNELNKYEIHYQKNQAVKKVSKEFALQYNLKMNNMVANRMLAASSYIADFWFSAWVDAGQPILKSEKELNIKIDYEAPLPLNNKTIKGHED